jgi:hypothetical protein
MTSLPPARTAAESLVRNAPMVPRYGRALPTTMATRPAERSPGGTGSPDWFRSWTCCGSLTSTGGWSPAEIGAANHRSERAHRTPFHRSRRRRHDERPRVAPVLTDRDRSTARCSTRSRQNDASEPQGAARPFRRAGRAPPALAVPRTGAEGAARSRPDSSPRFTPPNPVRGMRHPAGSPTFSPRAAATCHRSHRTLTPPASCPLGRPGLGAR